jgi:hypothetical protein
VLNSLLNSHQCQNHNFQLPAMNCWARILPVAHYCYGSSRSMHVLPGARIKVSPAPFCSLPYQLCMSYQGLVPGSALLPSVHYPTSCACPTRGWYRGQPCSLLFTTLLAVHVLPGAGTRVSPAPFCSLPY